jgi:hypothetical protein
MISCYGTQTYLRAATLYSFVCRISCAPVGRRGFGVGRGPRRAGKEFGSTTRRVGALLLLSPLLGPVEGAGIFLVLFLFVTTPGLLFCTKRKNKIKS